MPKDAKNHGEAKVFSKPAWKDLDIKDAQTLLQDVAQMIGKRMESRVAA